jgi:integrase/recombinase XerD
MLFVTTTQGKQFTRVYFNNWRRDCVVDPIGLRHCTPHGIRKGVLTIAAEEGATAHELMALAGHTNLAQTEVYTRKVRQARLTSSALSKVRLAR